MVYYWRIQYVLRTRKSANPSILIAIQKILCYWYSNTPHYAGFISYEIYYVIQVNVHAIVADINLLTMLKDQLAVTLPLQIVPQAMSHIQTQQGIYNNLAYMYMKVTSSSCMCHAYRVSMRLTDTTSRTTL